MARRPLATLCVLLIILAGYLGAANQVGKEAADSGNNPDNGQSKTPVDSGDDTFRTAFIIGVVAVLGVVGAVIVCNFCCKNNLCGGEEAGYTHLKDQELQDVKVDKAEPSAPQGEEEDKQPLYPQVDEDDFPYSAEKERMLHEEDEPSSPSETRVKAQPDFIPVDNEQEAEPERPPSPERSSSPESTGTPPPPYDDLTSGTDRERSSDSDNTSPVRRLDDTQVAPVSEPADTDLRGPENDDTSDNSPLKQSETLRKQPKIEIDELQSTPEQEPLITPFQSQDVPEKHKSSPSSESSQPHEPSIYPLLPVIIHSNSSESDDESPSNTPRSRSPHNDQSDLPIIVHSPAMSEESEGSSPPSPPRTHSPYSRDSEISTGGDVTSEDERNDPIHFSDTLPRSQPRYNPPFTASEESPAEELEGMSEEDQSEIQDDEASDAVTVISSSRSTPVPGDESRDHNAETDPETPTTESPLVLRRPRQRSPESELRESLEVTPDVVSEEDIHEKPTEEEERSQPTLRSPDKRPRQRSPESVYIEPASPLPEAENGVQVPLKMEELPEEPEDKEVDVVMRHKRRERSPESEYIDSDIIVPTPEKKEIFPSVEESEDEKENDSGTELTESEESDNVTAPVVSTDILDDDEHQEDIEEKEQEEEDFVQNQDQETEIGEDQDQPEGDMDEINRFKQKQLRVEDEMDKTLKDIKDESTGESLNEEEQSSEEDKEQEVDSAIPIVTEKEDPEMEGNKDSEVEEKPEEEKEEPEVEKEDPEVEKEDPEVETEEPEVEKEEPEVEKEEPNVEEEKPKVEKEEHKVEEEEPEVEKEEPEGEEEKPKVEKEEPKVDEEESEVEEEPEVEEKEEPEIKVEEPEVEEPEVEEKEEAKVEEEEPKVEEKEEPEVGEEESEVKKEKPDVEKEKPDVEKELTEDPVKEGKQGSSEPSKDEKKKQKD